MSRKGCSVGRVLRARAPLPPAAQVTPPPGFGGPPAAASVGGTTPPASSHTSLDSASALGVDADTLRAAARLSAAQQAQQAAQQAQGAEAGAPGGLEGYSPFSALGTLPAGVTAAAGGSSLFSSLGSSSSLAERLPSTGDLLAGVGEVGS